MIRTVLLLPFCLVWLSVALVAAESARQNREAGATATPASSSQPAAPTGQAVFQRKCFQCHQATMWSAVRGDRTMWEAVLYRMVGRGALWTEAEITAMAEFLAQTRGAQNP
jgi:cytochrome c5